MGYPDEANSQEFRDRMFITMYSEAVARASSTLPPPPPRSPRAPTTITVPAPQVHVSLEEVAEAVSGIGDAVLELKALKMSDSVARSDLTNGGLSVRQRTNIQKYLKPLGGQDGVVPSDRRDLTLFWNRAERCVRGMGDFDLLRLNRAELPGAWTGHFWGSGLDLARG